MFGLNGEIKPQNIFLNNALFVHSVVYAFGRVINITLSGLFELGFK